eukprot:gene10042-4673_t
MQGATQPTTEDRNSGRVTGFDATLGKPGEGPPYAHNPQPYKAER